MPTFDYSEKEVTWIHGGKKGDIICNDFLHPTMFGLPYQRKLPPFEAVWNCHLQTHSVWTKVNFGCLE